MASQWVGRDFFDWHVQNRRVPSSVMDVDSYWQGDDYVDEFSSSTLLELVDTLHRPIRAIFEASITDALRDEVLRRERNG